MQDKQIGRFPVPNIDELPTDIKNHICKLQKKIGFIPNVFLILSYRPDEFRAFIAYHDALMERESGLSKAEKEMIIVATSNDNGCQYCVIAHGAILRVRARDPLIADQVAINYKKSDISDRKKAMLKFALKVSNDSKSISNEDFDDLSLHGFSEDDIWDIAGITAFFGLSNRMANFTSMRANTEFYKMGR
tara:strand:+ start:196 stop:765 length:570 start_codon:yes stop_codon:yes gene_type:complete